MTFEPTQDQAMLRDSVERCLAETYTFDVRRAIVAAGGFDADLSSDELDKIFSQLE